MHSILKLLLATLFQRFSSGYDCFSCYGMSICDFSVGILKLLTKQEKMLMNYSTTFIKSMDILPPNLRINLR